MGGLIQVFRVLHFNILFQANSMESVSLFPKIHLELCDLQCKDDDLVIESSVTLKVRFLELLSLG